METDRAMERAALHANIDAVGSIALAGLVALCGELARLGALDTAALERIASFLKLTVEQTAASQNLRRHLHGEVERHFYHLQAAIGSAPPTGVKQ